MEMFSGALLESSKQRRSSRRHWATLTSLLAQCGLLAIMIALPMIYTDVLSVRYNPHVLAAPSMPTPPVPERPTTSSGDENSLHRISHAIAVHSGHHFDFHTVGIPDSDPLPPSSIPGPGKNVLFVDLMPPGNGVRLDLHREPPRKIITSNLMEGRLIHRVQPQYPQIAKLTRTQGVVILHAVIGKDGHIENLTVVSGPALLAESAKQAVKQWEYRPYILNGESVEVETQIIVNFTIGG